MGNIRPLPWDTVHPIRSLSYIQFKGWATLSKPLIQIDTDSFLKRSLTINQRSDSWYSLVTLSLVTLVKPQVLIWHPAIYHLLLVKVHAACLKNWNRICIMALRAASRCLRPAADLWRAIAMTFALLAARGSSAFAWGFPCFWCGMPCVTHLLQNVSYSVQTGITMVFILGKKTKNKRALLC